jgi:dolichyl-phosphate-mannose-protein mannosyltransferase
MFISFTTIIFVFLVIMYIHISIGKKMPVHTTYGMSKEYIQIIKEGKTSSLKYFPIMLRDNLKYMINYHKHVPKYNPCKKGENGSLAYTWPFGNKTINYRWEKHNGKVQYLYLVPNPVIWFLGFLGVVLANILVGGKLIFDLKIKDKKIFNLIALFTFIYFSYMTVMVNLSRVMYLYHYFIPLEFSLFLFALIFRYIFSEYIDKNDKILLISVIILTITIYLAYYYFSPFTYYKPLTYNEFMQRRWFEFWHLQPIR